MRREETCFIVATAKSKQVKMKKDGSLVVLRSATLAFGYNHWSQWQSLPFSRAKIQFSCVLVLGLSGQLDYSLDLSLVHSCMVLLFSLFFVGSMGEKYTVGYNPA